MSPSCSARPPTRKFSASLSRCAWYFVLTLTPRATAVFCASAAISSKLLSFSVRCASSAVLAARAASASGDAMPLAVAILNDHPRRLEVRADGEADADDFFHPFDRVVMPLAKRRVPAAQPVAVGGDVPEFVRDVAEKRFDANLVGRLAVVEVGVVEDEIPLWMQDAADGFKDGGFRGVAAAREANDVLVRERPVEFADAAIVPDREVANPHDPTPARLRANRGSITGSCRRFSNPVLRCGKWAAHWRLWGTAKARRARLRAVAGRPRSWTGLTRPGFASDNCRIDDGLELGTQFSTTGWGPHGTNAGRFKQGEADGDITLRPQRAALPA